MKELVLVDEANEVIVHLTPDAFLIEFDDCDDAQAFSNGIDSTTALMIAQRDGLKYRYIE